jgi:aminoglycoside N3'-acetyltransferase
MADMKLSIKKEDIKDGLKHLGIKPGCILGVHSSLSSFGYVDGGADTVLEALFEIVGQAGTIVMSTYLVGPPVELTEQDIAKGINWKIKRLGFDDLNTPSGMGIIADTFRRRPDVMRWYAPVYSVTAWGKDADIYCQSFRPLVEADGWILLLGVQMDRCSALHLAEGQVPFPEDIKSLMEGKVSEELLKVYPPGEWFFGCEDIWGNFLIVQQEAEALGMIETRTIGMATARLFKARPMVELYKKLLMENPYRIFGVKPNRKAPNTACAPDSQGALFTLAGNACH